ncbi:hypothetical protein [Nocardioides daeguensis]|uniref:Uncharacterized protein n=1 Tax=Nocardioides daeguensis TaxID=908359 RepID=A0ABP6VY55_9ACTN|nr:hypothetical protein [Nocardioides daeguensis]MBV6726839.1 hypothetical protein [Nocardioides daeguensis]MCR1774409.1 hypothetical protein [Nocardioides daeguensis]
MTSDLAVPTWLVVLTLVAVVALAVAAYRLLRSVRQARGHTEALLAAAAQDAEALREQLAGIEAELQARPEAAARGQRTPVAVVDDREYVITDLGQEQGPRVPARVVPAPMFADILLRESVIKTAALAAGLRRALSPEVRHRIRFEMKREVKRSRKERKLMLKAARRDLESRQRSALGADVEVTS